MPREKEDTLDDGQIIDLYWARSEAAITETGSKYGKYCGYIAGHILDRLAALSADARNIFLRRY